MIIIVDTISYRRWPLDCQVSAGNETLSRKTKRTGLTRVKGELHQLKKKYA